MLRWCIRCKSVQYRICKQFYLLFGFSGQHGESKTQICRASCCGWDPRDKGAAKRSFIGVFGHIYTYYSRWSNLMAWLCKTGCCISEQMEVKTAVSVGRNEDEEQFSPRNWSPLHHWDVTTSRRCEHAWKTSRTLPRCLLDDLLEYNLGVLLGEKETCNKLI